MGDVLTYTIRVNNPTSGLIVSSGSIVDALDPKFAYVETVDVVLAGGATLTSNNYDTSDPSKPYEPQIGTDASYP